MLNIVRYPHPALRHRSKPLRRVDQRLKALIDNMFDLMYEAKGIGLAANQVNLPFHLFVVNVTGDRQTGEELVFINPILSAPKGQATAEEGCLSLPGLFGDVSRAEQIRVSAYDSSGNQLDLVAKGMLARVIQHEYDHIQGVLFIDRINPIAQRSLAGELERMEREFNAQRIAGELGDDNRLKADLLEWESNYC